MKRHDTVGLFDVDNTLLDNDRVVTDFRRHLRRLFGAHADRRYFKIFEDLRTRLGYTDYLGALQRYRLEHPGDPHILRMSSYLIHSPFAKRLYPRALDVLRQSRRWGPTVILSDGDAVFQPHKVEQSGLWKAFLGRGVIFVSKEQML